MPPAGKSTKREDLDFVKQLLRGVVASSRSKSSTFEGLGFLRPLWRIVVAPGGSKSSTIEGLGFFKPLWPTVVASSRSKSKGTLTRCPSVELGHGSLLTGRLHLFPLPFLSLLGFLAILVSYPSLLARSNCVRGVRACLSDFCALFCALFCFASLALLVCPNAPLRSLVFPCICVALEF